MSGDETASSRLRYNTGWGNWIAPLRVLERLAVNDADFAPEYRAAALRIYGAPSVAGLPAPVKPSLRRRGWRSG